MAQRVRLWGIGLLAGNFALGIGAIAVQRTAFFPSFAPSSTWAALVSTPALIAASVAGLLAALAVLFWPALQPATPHKLSTRLAEAAGAGLLLIALPLYASVTLGLPMLAALAGKSTTQSHVIATTNVPRAKGCSGGLNAADLPFLVHRLCTATEEQRSQLDPGDTVTLHGYGTALGVFYTHLTLP